MGMFCLCGDREKSCGICGAGDGCLAGNGDDDFFPATKEQIIERLDRGQYKGHRDIMIKTLKEKFNYEYIDIPEPIEKGKRFEMSKEILNAKITSVSITMADHGCLTFWVTLNGGGWGVNVGGYCIGHGYLGAEEFDSTSGLGLVAMMRIMDTVGVSRWEDLKGQYVRAEVNGWGGTVTKIGNILKDKWFDIDEFFKKNQKD